MHRVSSASDLQKFINCPTPNHTEASCCFFVAMYGSARNFGVLFLARPLSTSAVRLQDAESVAAKKDYYKHMADVQNTQNTRPDSWDNAKPFQEIPGPKPLPLLGNTWRFLPVFGDYHNVPLKDVHSK